MIRLTLAVLVFLAQLCDASAAASQEPLARHAQHGRPVSAALFAELEELARVVDISYCVGLAGSGIGKPFTCLSRCRDFPDFELVTTWNTGPLLSDSCGYIALDHGKRRIIVSFRGTYSIANAIVDLGTVPQRYVPYPGDGAPSEADSSLEVRDLVVEQARRSVSAHGEAHCANCTVHWGFYSSWIASRNVILRDLSELIFLYPHFELHLVGHSLGGAVAALAALDLRARGWEPKITSFGEPRVGNAALAEYINQQFDLLSPIPDNDVLVRYRRVTHVDDPVPLLPLGEWGYAMHAGEIYISTPNLAPDMKDLQHCIGNNDADCIAGQDSPAEDEARSTDQASLRNRDLLGSVQHELHDVNHEPWGIPSRYKLWQLIFAHRDYFWRLGLCVPSGVPSGKESESPTPKESL